MKIVVLSASLMMLSFLGTASSDPQPVVNNSVPSIDFNAPASGPSCVAQSSAESSAVEQVPAPIYLAPYQGYCYNDCSTCFPVGSLCSNHRGQCTSIPLC
jgi:hypothetical protein